MRAPLRALAFGLALALGVADSPRIALAKPRVEVSSQISVTQVEVGDSFTVTLRVKGDKLSVSSPSLNVTSELSVMSSSIARHTFMVLPSRSMETAIDATWEVLATRTGRITIAAPTAIVNGKRMSGQSLVVEVVPGTGNGSGRKKRAKNPFSFPGMPNSPFNSWPFGNDVEPDDEPPASARPDLNMSERAPDSRAFVRALVDKSEAVVGEQVTVRYYAYCSLFCEPRQTSEPNFPSFRRVPLDKGDPDEPQGTAKVGGDQFVVKLMARYALFPLEAGDPTIGKLELNMEGRRFGAQGERRVSNEPKVHVVEPPMQGRPPGYAGDVGQFSMTAIVQPRKVEVGGSVGVTVRVIGTGLLPEALRVPDQNGVEWLDPEKKEKIDVQGGKVTGARTYGYVVKLKNGGEIDLGSVALPFWDPVAKRYQTAQAALGAVEVSPAVASSDPADATVAPAAANDLFASLPAARRELGAFTPASSASALSGARFWGVVAAPPVGVAFGIASLGAVRALVKRRKKEAGSPRAAAEKAIAEARASSDPKVVAAAIERATHSAIEAAYGLRSRGVLLGELASELTKRGASEAIAVRARDLLVACDGIRFDPEASRSAQELAASAEVLVAEFLRAAPT